MDSIHREPTFRRLRRGVACTMGRRYIHLTCSLGVNGWCIAISLMLWREDKTVLRDSLEKSLSIIRCCTKGPIDWRMANLAKQCGCHIWLMTQNIRGLVLELEEGRDEKCCITYHLRTRFATSKSGIVTLVPFSDTASSKIDSSSSRGKIWFKII